MKIIILFTVLMGVALADENDYYKTADDNLNMQDVVDDPKRLQSFVDCFLDKKPCDPVAESYKEHIPESIAKGCHRCSTAQKHLVLIFLTGLKEKKPQDYDSFLKKYDPSGENIQKLVEKLKSKL